MIMLFKPHINRGWTMVDTRNVTKKYDSRCNNKHNNITKQKLVKNRHKKSTREMMKIFMKDWWKI
jgi:hypothetical protein